MRRHVFWTGVAGGVFALAAFLWLSGSVQEFLRPQKPYNVIFIHIDTLRADHLGLYGYSRNTSPNLDKFSQESLVFEQAISQAPWTLPSYASILTSQYPSTHGLVGREECVSSIHSSQGLVERKGCISSSKLTLAEVLKKQEYKTAAFVGDGDLKSLFGFSQGFDVYIDNTHNSEKMFFDTTIPLAEEWMSQNKKSKFFLYVQGYDVHTPYHKPEPYDHMFDETYSGLLADHAKFYFFDDYKKKPRSILQNIKKLDNKPYLVQDDATKIPLTQRDIDHIVAHYDGGIRYMDNLIQGFFDQLKEMGLYDNSIIVVFGDHGETIGDDLTRRAEQSPDRLVGHFKVYDELVRVPLLIKAPGLKPGRVSSQVQLIDLFPTILDFLNIPQNKEIRNELQGKSLVSVIEGKESEEFAYGEIGKRGELSFVRTLKWKFIRRGDSVFLLYDLENDPGETKDVIEEHQDVANSLKKNLFEWSFINLEKKAKTP